MRDASFINQLERRLVELGCPPKRRRRLVQEMAEHGEDLRRAALAEGMSEEEAEARAAERLGNPQELAEREMVVWRRSSWWGRHCFVSFCLLPLVAVPLIWAAILGAECYVAAYVVPHWYGEDLHGLANDMAAHPAFFHKMAKIFYAMDDLAVALTTTLLWWQAWRLGVKFRWLAAGCGIVSSLAALLWTRVSPHSLNVGLGMSFGWTWFKHYSHKELTPWLVFGIAALLRWRSVQGWRTRVALGADA